MCFTFIQINCNKNLLIYKSINKILHFQFNSLYAICIIILIFIVHFHIISISLIKNLNIHQLIEYTFLILNRLFFQKLSHFHHDLD